MTSRDTSLYFLPLKLPAPLSCQWLTKHLLILWKKEREKKKKIIWINIAKIKGLHVLLAVQTETVVSCYEGFHFWCCERFQWWWGVNDSLIANTKGFHRTKIWLQKVPRWKKKTLPQHLVLYNRLAHLLYTSTRVRTHTHIHINTCTLHNSHIAFQLFESL